MAAKSFDIILIGATGFTGRRAARYLQEHAPADTKWGLAARNQKKLSKLAEELNLPKEKCFIVDTTIAEQVEEVVKQTNIIITTAGPFSLYGEELIAACAKFGSHYLDITGEVGFIKKMNEKYGQLARKNEAILIPFSGFDSVPADIAAFLLSKEFNAPKKLTIRATYKISGGVNGGTIATMLNKFETGEYKEMNNPALLIEGNEQNIHSPKNAAFFGFDRRLKRWSVPFIMGAINSKIVYKTASELRKENLPYANSISYSEHLSVGKWYNPIPFISVSLVLILLSVLGPKKWFREFIRKIMPAPGEGPSEEKIENGFFSINTIAHDENDYSVSLQISYPGDPGNKSTVFFLCESALLLAKSENSFVGKSGFYTPMSIFGQQLVDRLSERGLNIKKSA